MDKGKHLFYHEFNIKQASLGLHTKDDFLPIRILFDFMSVSVQSITWRLFVYLSNQGHCNVGIYSLCVG